MGRQTSLDDRSGWFRESRRHHDAALKGQQRTITATRAGETARLPYLQHGQQYFVIGVAPDGTTVTNTDLHTKDPKKALEMAEKASAWPSLKGGRDIVGRVEIVAAANSGEAHRKLFTQLEKEGFRKKESKVEVIDNGDDEEIERFG